MTTRSCRRDTLVCPLTGLGGTGLVAAISAYCGACAGGTGRSAGTVEKRVDIACGLGRQTGHPLQLLARGGEDRFGRPEVVEQGTLARRPDPRQAVEQGTGHRAVAPRAVMGDGEAVGLVADA